jgi:hypothetical protein
LMGAALVGGALGSLGGVAAADDECKPTGKKCRKDKQCCSGKCEGGTCSANVNFNRLRCTCESEVRSMCELIDCASSAPDELCTLVCAGEAVLAIDCRPDLACDT